MTIAIMIAVMLLGYAFGRFLASKRYREEPFARVARGARVVSSGARGPSRRVETDRQPIETGKYDPSLPLAFKIARLFARNIEDIFDPEG